MLYHTKKVLAICLFLIVNTIVFSQNKVFDRITTKDGLSQNDVNAVLQDKDGFLWIATHDGLNRYDGYSFKTFHVNPDSEEGISSNLIFDLVQDNNGNLWIATTGEGVCLFDVKAERFTVFKNTPENPNLLISNNIRCLMASKDGTVWVGSEKGIDIIKQEVTTQVYYFAHTKNEHVI